jgi:hypothetical protein
MENKTSKSTPGSLGQELKGTQRRDLMKAQNSKVHFHSAGL